MDDKCHYAGAGIGSIASFGAYMMMISFSVLPARNSLLQVFTAAAIMIFSRCWVSVPQAAQFIFPVHHLAATAQGMAELRGGIYACRSHWQLLFSGARTIILRKVKSVHFFLRSGLPVGYSFILLFIPKSPSHQLSLPFTH